MLPRKFLYMENVESLMHSSDNMRALVHYLVKEAPHVHVIVL